MVVRHLLLPQKIQIILSVNNFSLPKKVRLPAKWRNVFQMAPPYLLILVQHLKPANALLNHERLRIVTNNLNAAHLLRQNETFDITMAGGSLRKDGGIIGEATVNFISQFRLDFGILGISAIDLDGSLLDYDYHEVQVKRAIIESSRQTLLATDHSKFSRQAIVRLGELKDVDYLFTDDVPKQIEDYLENSNTKLVICK